MQNFSSRALVVKMSEWEIKGDYLTKRRTFDRKYVFTELDKLSASIVVPTQFFIIGGLALISYGLKEATKDIDVVVRSARATGSKDKIISA